ncbi:hypothetical protein ACVW1A_000201 [Bradyrhizobium sp. LB1.3]
MHPVAVLMGLGVPIYRLVKDDLLQSLLAHRQCSAAMSSE